MNIIQCGIVVTNVLIETDRNRFSIIKRVAPDTPTALSTAE